MFTVVFAESFLPKKIFLNSKSVFQKSKKMLMTIRILVLQPRRHNKRRNNEKYLAWQIVELLLG